MDKKRLQKDGIKYLKKDKNLTTMDVLAIINIVKILLEVQLNVNLKSLDQTALLRVSELEYKEQYNIRIQRTVRQDDKSIEQHSY